MNPRTIPSARPRLQIWTGALWSAVNLLTVTSILIFAAFFVVTQPPSPGGSPLDPPLAPYALLWVSAMVMLVLAVLTAPAPRVDEWNADFSPLPRPVRWILAAGIWIGRIWVLLVNLVTVFTTEGGGDAVLVNMRVILATMSLAGALTTVVLSIGLMLPGSALLLASWLVAFSLILLRGLLGLFRLLPPSWLKPRA